MLVQISAKECLLPKDANNPDMAKLQMIAERSGIMVTHRKKTEFSTRFVEPC